VEDYQIYIHLLRSSIINSEETTWLVREGYCGAYDPAYLSKKAEVFIAEFESKRIEKVIGYLKLNGSITIEKLKDIVATEAHVFEVFIARMVKHHKLIRKKPGNIYVLRKKWFSATGLY